MESFVADDGVRVAYHEWGASNPGVPVLLHHGFINSARSNCESTGFVEALTTAGRRVVGIDARGHGDSDKPHDPSKYGERRMSADHLGLGRYDLVGYSMGAVVSLITASLAGAELVVVDGNHLSALTHSPAQLVVDFLERS